MINRKECRRKHPWPDGVAVLSRYVAWITKEGTLNHPSLGSISGTRHDPWAFQIWSRRTNKSTTTFYNVGEQNPSWDADRRTYFFSDSPIYFESGGLSRSQVSYIWHSRSQMNRVLTFTLYLICILIISIFTSLFPRLNKTLRFR